MGSIYSAHRDLLLWKFWSGNAEIICFQDCSNQTCSNDFSSAFQTFSVRQSMQKRNPKGAGEWVLSHLSQWRRKIVTTCTIWHSTNVKCSTGVHTPMLNGHVFRRKMGWCNSLLQYIQTGQITDNGKEVGSGCHFSVHSHGVKWAGTPSTEDN